MIFSYICQERYSHNKAFYSLDESIVDYITLAIYSLVIRRNSQLLIGPFLRLWVVVPEGQDVSWLCEDTMEDPPPDTRQKHPGSSEVSARSRNHGLPVCPSSPIEKAGLLLLQAVDVLRCLLKNRRLGQLF